MGKIIVIGLLGLLNAGWYVIPKGQLYSAKPGQSGKVMTVGNVFSLFGSLIPPGLGMVAEFFGLLYAMWLMLIGPLVLAFGIPRCES